jgi:hypothetical protein
MRALDGAAANTIAQPLIFVVLHARRMRGVVTNERVQGRPALGRGRSQRVQPRDQLFFNRLFLVKDGKVEAIEKVPDAIAAPNGIALSADEKYLYAGYGGKIWRYDIRPDDSVINPRMVIESRVRTG